MSEQLLRRRAIVTGGGSGIGAAIVSAFEREGAEVYVLDIEAKGDRSLSCDVGDPAAVQRAVAEIAGDGALDILVNNAGIGFVGKLEQTTEADLDRLYRVNVKGVYNCSLACLPYLKKGTHPVILNMASVAGSVAVANRFAYSMTKGAVLAMTYSIAKDYLAEGIRCNSISPARVHTPFVDDYLRRNYPGREEAMLGALAATQPIGRMGRPDEIADLAVYLCSDRAGFVTGTDFPIDGGFIRLNS